MSRPSSSWPPSEPPSLSPLKSRGARWPAPTPPCPPPSASKHLVQLSKHWSHRFPDLTYTSERADIPLPFGPCVLEPATEALDITVSVASEPDLPRAQQVVTDHLLRFARRETLVVVWEPSRP